MSLPLFIKLLRPKQWTKNLFVFAPILFAVHYLDLESWYRACIAALCFICFSGTVYIFNDICDVKEDQSHPIKKHRPIASRAVSIPIAVMIAILALLAGTFLLITQLPIGCTYIMVGYILLQILYTFSLKHIAIFDVLVIAAGFVLRVLMGGYAAAIAVSPWVIVATYLLALFLGFGKRYHEFSVEGYAEKRDSLKSYNKPFLNHLMAISCVSALLFYALYAVETARLLEKPALVYTIIFVIIGLFRYLQVLHVDKKGGEPEQILFSDMIFILNGFAWVIITIGILSL